MLSTLTFDCKRLVSYYYFCFYNFSFIVQYFLRGNGASVARIIPYAALHYMAYEQYRRWIILAYPTVNQGPVLDLMAGSFSGATAVLFTYPLDLVRTKLAYQVAFQLFLLSLTGFFGAL